MSPDRVFAHVVSKDGTRIAYERMGSGPAVVLIDGAMCSRAFGPMPKIAALLKEHFTVYLYDRRGRGESGDTEPYSKAREVEDIEALVRAAGGSAFSVATPTSSYRRVSTQPMKANATMIRLTCRMRASAARGHSSAPMLMHAPYSGVARLAKGDRRRSRGISRNRRLT